MTNSNSAAQQIIDAVGGAENVRTLTHCATRLRFELRDASKVDQDTVENVDGVMGAVPQSGDRYQVIIGGTVATVYNDIMHLPSMSNKSQSDEDVKAAARAGGVRGKNELVNNFFEYLSDSFRPILGVLLATSLVIAFASIMEACNVQNFHADNKPGGWVLIDAMWRSVFYFLPLMIAYNASNKLKVDPWLGTAVMASLITPNFISLMLPDGVNGTVCTINEALNKQTCTADVFGMRMQLDDYGGNVFLPLIMPPILALLYHGLKKVIPGNLQMVFVPFLCLIVMVPVSAFLLGPVSVWVGNGLGQFFLWMTTNAPFVFAIIIPLVYPFLVPLGLHWPLNAMMLMNINNLGYDFIQGPMGVWNFACFGATAGVLILSIRDKDKNMRQTATGALFAGLLGGISEPSLYGIHLRNKGIYPRMLTGCAVGGVVIAVLSQLFTGHNGDPSGVTTSAFAFTSLLTIPVFKPIWIYIISVAASFFTAMFMILIFDYRPRSQGGRPMINVPFLNKGAEAEAAAKEEAAKAAAAKPAAKPAAAKIELHTDSIASPVAGKVLPLEETGDETFAQRILGEGVAVEPSEGIFTAPVSGELTTVAGSKHAFGIKTDDGVEILVHIGIDTVQLNGKGFVTNLKVGDKVNKGDKLADADLNLIKEAGYKTITAVTVTNTKKLVKKAGANISPLTGKDVKAGDAIIRISR